MTIKADRMFNLILLITSAFALVTQILRPETAQEKTASVLLFIGIVTYVVIVYSLDWFMGRIKYYMKQIKVNTEAIAGMKKQLDAQRKFNEMDKRLSLLELLKKKGEINPRWVMLAGLLILFFLYLRSIGLFENFP